MLLYVMILLVLIFLLSVIILLVLIFRSIRIVVHRPVRCVFTTEKGFLALLILLCLFPAYTLRLCYEGA